MILTSGIFGEGIRGRVVYAPGSVGFTYGTTVHEATLEGSYITARLSSNRNTGNDESMLGLNSENVMCSEEIYDPSGVDLPMLPAFP